MEPVLAALEASEIAQALRYSRWGYATLNTVHVLGIAILVGGILPLNLRLLGLWPQVDAAGLVRVLVPMAAGGLVLALTTGTLLFAVRATEYAGNLAFLVKIVLVSVGAASALATHLAWGRWLDRAPRAVLVRAGLVSVACWTGALIAGRMIAYVGD